MGIAAGPWIVFLTEERSMKETLRVLLQRCCPEQREGLDWFIFDFRGKSDLDKHIQPTQRGWNFGTPWFVILLDADGKDCTELKDALVQRASSADRPVKIRIVCQELESWLLGDSAAVRAAYPHSKLSNKKNPFRDPDKLINASELLAQQTGDRSKIRRATQIATHMDPTRNVSHSFQVFYSLLDGPLEAS